MTKDIIQGVIIEELLSSDAGQNIRQIIETISAVQNGLYALVVNGDSAQLDLLKIGTVFQIYFVETLAAGKNPGDLTEDDWKSIADKVYKYAVLEEGQTYSEFVFTLYADYIDISIETLRGKASEKNLAAIKDLSDTIRSNTESLQKGEIDEVAYVEACLWLSLEAMIKLLCAFSTKFISQEYADLLQSISQLAFEYGRYALYSKEQAILEKYLQNQYVLDEQLQREYEFYLESVRVQAEAFQELIDNAFSADIKELLVNSAALARAAGVKEEEILESIENVDSFFLD
ncbi:MAG: hypothetical protein IJH64_09745 [Oscillospiraceae bacterium]|nr:hypothetical protein [Oscillospiraceae bacterium]